MKSPAYGLHVLILTFLLISCLQAEILNVPDDHETIQAAIDAAEDGDTVLVDPGEYVENIDFNGKNITVASLYLIDPNDDYINSTIIDGDENGSVVTFENEETEDAVLTGFTIQNGAARNGGGICCLESSPTISYCVIMDNFAQSYGGGIYFRQVDMIIECCYIINNHSPINSGYGGFYSLCSDITFDHCIISDNGVGENTNTFVIHASNNTFINCTFSNNSSNNDVFIRINSESVVSFENSIIWLNSAGCISLTDDCVITFSYTNFEGGQENISSNGGEVNWGEGNIDDDPLFSDPDNGDYHLTENSPCIDAGDPDSPEDPDETRADMGAYYFDQRRDDEIEWTEHVIDGDFDGAYDVDVADIDGDGDIDVVGVAEDDNTVAWWENDGNEEFQRHVIDNNFTRGRVVLTVDFDGDGDIDVIAGAATRGGQVKWYENNNGDFEGHVIDDEIYVNALFAEDIDSDGDIDLLGSWEQPRVVVETLFWWENDGEQNFEVHYERAPSRIQDVVVLDIDDDGDIDILACTESRDESVIWWENDGSQDFSEESMHIICEDISNSSTLFPVDFDDDNDIDIILGTDQSQVYWLENNGNENFEYHLIMDDLEGVTSVYVVDLDFDEDLDVLISKYGEEGNYITWMENLGNDEFSENVIDEDFNGCWSLKAVDLDQDGDFDCVGSSRFEDSITWWENNLNPPIPDIAVEPDALDFGEVNVDEISEQTFTITNNGEADLIISEISTEGDYFAVEFEDEFLLETDQEVEITVTFSPEEEGEFAGVITIISNDPDAREVEVTLAGIGRRDDEIEWTEHVIDGDFDGAYDVYAADIDGDGDMDIIGVAFDGGYSAFWENNGNEEFERVVIDVHFNYGVVVKAVDLNSDGNIDVIAGTDGQGRLVKWYEYIEGNFWGHVLESGIPNGVHSLYPQDIDSDGDIDILAGRFNNENALMWWENDGEQNMERYWDIDGCQRIQDVAALDLNEDGEIDFLACRDLSDEAVIWLENNGNEEFNQNCRHAIFSGVEGCRTIFPVDFDGDEDIDIVLGSDTEGLIFWLENDGDEDFEYHLIAEGCEGVTTVYMVDFDLDDDLDVLVSLCEGDDNIIWLENHGDNEFSRYLVSDGFGTPLSVIADDVDGDGDFDIVGASYDDDEITWWENNIIEIPHPDIAVEPMELDFGEVNVNESEELSLTIINNGDENLTVEGFSVEGEYFEINNENGFMLRPNQRSTRTVTFSPEEAGEFAGIVTITSNDPQSREVEVALAGIAVHANIFTAHQIHRNSAGARAIAAVEMNNDGNIDIVACEMEDLYWYENNGEQEFEEHHIAQNSDDIHYPRKVVVIDFDGDDDLDIFLTNYTGNSIYWYENSGDNEFEEHVVDDDFRAPRGLNATDFDNDGDVDVIAGGVAGDGLAWWENDGDQNLEKHVIGGDEENSCYSIYTVDYDEDGDMDVIAGDFNGQIIFWENDGDQEFDRHIIEQSQHPGSVYTIDLDNDADLDVLTASYSINLIFWLENEGNGDYSNHVINNHISRCYSVSAADFDLDGDTDILAAGDDETCWWENDGEMGLTEHAVPDNLANAMSVVPIDLDKDGDFDILGGALNAATTWWENNLNPPIPDIAVEPDALDFGEVNVDEISEQTFSISNNGEADLIVSEISIEDDYFSVEFEEEIVLETDEEVEITVAFAPEETGEYAGLITIFSNDPDEREVEVALAGVGRRDDEIEWSEHVIDEDFDGATSVFCIDIDDDNDMDILGASVRSHETTWWENDGEENFEEHCISGDLNCEASCVYATDMDGDGDIDVLGAGYDSDEILWWENDGEEGFELHTISNEVNGANCVYAMDMDGDDDIDVLGVACLGDEVIWWENDGELNFEEHIISDDYDGAWKVYAIDIDEDGDIDVLSAASEADCITLWENEGDQDFSRRDLEENYNSASDVYASDIDSDGDIDVLGSSYSDDKVTWWENDEERNFNAHTIARRFDSVNSIACADLDNDDDIDVLGTSLRDDLVTWWENDGAGNFSAHNISDEFDAAFDLYTSDIDSDGDIDVVALAYSEGKVSWFENSLDPPIPDITVEPMELDFEETSVDEVSEQTFTISNSGEADLIVSDISVEGDYFSVGFEDQVILEPDEEVEITVSFAPEEVGEFAGLVTIFTNDPDEREVEVTLSGIGRRDVEIEWTEHVIDGNFDQAFCVYTTDMDGDGDIDVLGAAAVDDDITWWENDGEQNFSEHTIARFFDGAISVYAIDIDNDSDIDVLGAAYLADQITWWENDGHQDFTEHNIQNDFDYTFSVYSMDIDGDGDVDVLGSANGDDEIAWWENDGDQNFRKHTIDDSFDGAWGIHAVDIDRDGDIDLLGAASEADDIAWWENDGDEGFERHTISDHIINALCVYASDIDGDGDIDLLGAASEDDRVSWWENEGDHDFSQRIISYEINTPISVSACDMDGDGDMDVLGSSYEDNQIIWWENNGHQRFTEHIITYNYEGARTIQPIDVDEDGDIDILSAAYIADCITWWENDGDQDFRRRDITDEYNGARDVYGADIDSDGDIDVLGAASISNDVTWWENDGDENFSVHNIANDFAAARSVYSADFDQDGDMDVIGAAGEANEVILWENDGNEDFSPCQISESFGGARDIYASDIDSDGDYDILGAAVVDNLVVWWENKLDLSVPDIAVEPDTLDFGEILLRENAEEILTITNEGNADLNVINISIDSEVFSVEFDDVFAVEPDAEYEITVVFNPEEAREYEALLTIRSDDPNEPTMVIPICGTGIGGDPEVVSPIEDTELDEDFEPFVIADLDTVFRDPNEDELAYYVESNDENLIVEIVDGTLLRLSSEQDWYGEAVVTVTADNDVEERDRGPVRELRGSRRTSIHACQDNELRMADRNRLSNNLVQSAVTCTHVTEKQGLMCQARTPDTTEVVIHRQVENVCPNDQLRTSKLVHSGLNRDAQAESAFTVTVNPVNDPPYWYEYPEEPVEVEAGERIYFDMVNEDIDDPIVGASPIWDTMPEGAGFATSRDGKFCCFIWETDRVDIGEYHLQFITGDGEYEDEIEVTIIVNPSRTPWHFTDFDTTAVSHHLRITELALYERNAQTGWEVGVFTEEGLLAGAGVWFADEVLTVEAWADNPETDETDGFRENEQFSFLIWEPDEDREYDGVAWFEEGPEIWQEDATTTLSLDAFVPGETVVSFLEGWNYISINVYPGPVMYRENQPEGPDIVFMTEQLRIDEERHHIITMKNDQGGIYAPAFDFNNIYYWSLIDAYQVQIDETIESTWYGAKIPYYTDIPLSEGWNLTPYYPDYELSADAPDFYVLSNIIESVVFAKDDNGYFLVPRYRYSEMPSWLPGKGYYINVSEDVTLNYPEEQERGAAVSKPQMSDNTASHWNLVLQSRENMSLLLTSISDDIASDGDEMAVFGSSGCLAGVGIVSDAKCGISVWGDDTETEFQEGLMKGEAFELKVWRAESDVERNLKIRAILYGDHLTYTVDELLVIEVELTPEIPQTVSLTGAYPNPFNSVIRFTYSIPEESFVKLAVYDLRGNEIEILTNCQQSTGHYSTNWNGIGTPSGVYIVRLEAGSVIDVRKIVLMR